MNTIYFQKRSSCIGRVIVLSSFLLLSFCQAAIGQDIEQLPDQEPLTFHGAIEARAITYSAKGIAPRYLPFNYLITGAPVLSVYGVQIPIFFSFSRQQNSFTQPFNQFGMSPHYKWITVHAGYRNLIYSPFTLAGHTFLGGGVELRPGKWRIDAMYGRFNKATVLDTLQGVYIENFTYQRTGYAFKLGYGNDKTFFDLITLKAKDNPSSTPAAQESMLDSLQITPAENWVNGYQARITLLKDKLILESDGAVSLYTRDVNAPAIEDSTVQDIVKPFKPFTTINYSTNLYSALQASITYKVRFMSMKVQYRRVDPGYTSMGAYFLNNDLENITVNPSFMLRQGKIRFTGSLGFQRDNLQNLKRATSDRVIGAANLSADLTDQIGIDLSYTNFSNTQRARSLRFADSLRIAQSTVNFSATPRFFKATTQYSHSVILSLNYNLFQDLNGARSVDGIDNDIQTQTYFATYQIGFVPSRSSLFATVNYARLSNDAITDLNNGLTVGGSKSLVNNKMVLTASSGYIQSDRNGAKGYVLNESIQIRFLPHRSHSFQVMAIFIGNYPDVPSELQRRFTELRGELAYQFNF